MTFPSDISETVMKKELYDNEKTESLSVAKSLCEKTEDRRRFVIISLACTKYLDELRSDPQLKITEAEYQLARQCAYKKEKEDLWEYGLNINIFSDWDDIKEALEAKGYSDLVKIDNELKK